MTSSLHVKMVQNGEGKEMKKVVLVNLAGKDKNKKYGTRTSRHSVKTSANPSCT